MKILKLQLVALCSLFFFASGNAQESGNKFEDKIDLDVTSVKNQYRSGTCWSFAAVSFLEAELLRQGNGEYDLSEMFLVRKSYEDKAMKYVRMHGKTNFAGGGLAHDLIHVWKKYGLVPESAYPGLLEGEKGHVHGEMDGVLKAYVEDVIKNRNQQLSPVWIDGYRGIIDAYLGEHPGNFNYNGNKYTPVTFAESLEVDPDEYITVGSFTHHPFYQPFILEIPDNWGWNEIHNVPLKELMQLLNNALVKGYTVCWDADVGETGFNWGKGVAKIPVERAEELANLEEGRWSEMSEKEKKKVRRSVEMEIDQELRQKWFDNYNTTDDHLMHITGKAVDKDGKMYYKVKNSWGTEGHIYDGYLYCSEAYMKAKTIFFMLHKDAVPGDLAIKLGL